MNLRTYNKGTFFRFADKENVALSGDEKWRKVNTYSINKDSLKYEGIYILPAICLRRQMAGKDLSRWRRANFAELQEFSFFRLIYFPWEIMINCLGQKLEMRP